MSSLAEVRGYFQVPAVTLFCQGIRSKCNFPYFDAEGLECALVPKNYNDYLTMEKILIKLLSICSNVKDVGSNNWDVVLRGIISKKWPSEGLKPPLQDYISVRFHDLSLQNKVDVLYSLCHYCLDAGCNVGNDIDSHSWRGSLLGTDHENCSYWYFNGIRLYKEDRSEGYHHANVSARLNPGRWSVACFTMNDWEMLKKRLKRKKAAKNEDLIRAIEEKQDSCAAALVEKERQMKKLTISHSPRRISSRIYESHQRQIIEMERAAEIAQNERQIKEEEELKRKDLEEKQKKGREMLDRANRLKERQKIPDARITRATFKDFQTLVEVANERWDAFTDTAVHDEQHDYNANKESKPCCSRCVLDTPCEDKENPLSCARKIDASECEKCFLQVRNDVSEHEQLNRFSAKEAYEPSSVSVFERTSKEDFSGISPDTLCTVSDSDSPYEITNSKRSAMVLKLTKKKKIKEERTDMPDKAEQFHSRGNDISKLTNVKSPSKKHQNKKSRGFPKSDSDSDSTGQNTSIASNVQKKKQKLKAKKIAKSSSDKKIAKSSSAPPNTCCEVYGTDSSCEVLWSTVKNEQRGIEDRSGVRDRVFERPSQQDSNNILPASPQKTDDNSDSSANEMELENDKNQIALKLTQNGIEERKVLRRKVENCQQFCSQGNGISKSIKGSMLKKSSDQDSTDIFSKRSGYRKPKSAERSDYRKPILKPKLEKLKVTRRAKRSAPFFH